MSGTLNNVSAKIYVLFENESGKKRNICAEVLSHSYYYMVKLT